jgi:Spy/CpxP family protein refolding chaperone
MNKKFILIIGAGFLIVLGFAASTTYMCLKHFSNCQTVAPSMAISSAHEWAHKIGLTEDQEQKLAPYEASLKKDMQSIQVKLAEERIALCRLIQQEPANSKKVTEYTERVSALEAKQQQLVINHLIVMRDILTPDQRQKLFSSLMHEICVGCRQMVPGQKCMCGMCKMDGHTK